MAKEINTPSILDAIEKDKQKREAGLGYNTFDFLETEKQEAQPVRSKRKEESRVSDSNSKRKENIYPFCTKLRVDVYERLRSLQIATRRGNNRISNSNLFDEMINCFLNVHPEIKKLINEK